MGHFFAMFIGLDIMNISKINFIFDESRLRLIVYCTNVFFMAIIIASCIEYFYERENNLMFTDHYVRNVSECAYFMLAFICLFIAVALVLSILVSVHIIENVVAKNICSIVVLICCGMILSVVDMSEGTHPYNKVLSLVPLIMIVYDLQSL